jgi:hypothetical protein
MIMEPFDAFRFYQSVKLHFESDTYDAIKYNYKTSAKPQTFWKRKDKYFFAKVGRRFTTPVDLINYYVSHFIHDTKWIGEMINDDDTYNKWLKKNQSMGYVFEQDLYKLKEINESFDKLLDSSDGHPQIISAYMRDEISIETVVIVNRLTQFIRVADRKITETIVWPDVSRKIRKYEAFFQCDTDKMKKTVLKVFTN